MRSSIVAALVALIFALGAQAQQTAPKEHSMTGCLKKGTEANTYMLTDGKPFDRGSPTLVWLHLSRLELEKRDGAHG